jgi:hypothetical protein
MTSLVLHTHTGLGDHLITNGMTHAFAERYDKVYVIHLEMFSESIKTLYAGFDKIETVAFPDKDINLYQRHKINELAMDTNSELVSIADPYLYYPKRLILDKDGRPQFVHTAVNFDRQFYELAGMHFSIRYTKCRIPESTERSKEIFMDLTHGKDYRLVHKTSSQSTSGYPLLVDTNSPYQNLPLIEIKPGITNNIFDFVDLIKNAKEIHTVGSFFHNLVDCMTDKTNARLVFHNIMIKHETQINCFWNNNRWIQIDYDYKY